MIRYLMEYAAALVICALFGSALLAIDRVLGAWR